MGIAISLDSCVCALTIFELRASTSSKIFFRNLNYVTSRCERGLMTVLIGQLNTSTSFDRKIYLFAEIVEILVLFKIQGM